MLSDVVAYHVAGSRLLCTGLGHAASDGHVGRTRSPVYVQLSTYALKSATRISGLDAGVPRLNLHALRHRRISLLHRQGVSWAEIGDRVGQRSRLVTADRYSHALVDYRELDRRKLLPAKGGPLVG